MNDILVKIHLMPYNHCDYAWTHTRQWHVWRYVECFRQVLDIMKENKDFTFLVDSVAQTGQILFNYLPERIDEVRALAREGRLCVANGGVELLRPSQNGGELYVRNMVKGKSSLREIFQTVNIPVFFNADTAIGHSQMPQLLKLGGYSAYRFMRPNGSLDYNRIPVNFSWRGLDGSEIIVSRGNYVGLCGDYMAEDLNAQLNGFYDNEVKPKMDIQPMKDLLIFLGGDDSLPMKNMYDIPIDIPKFFNAWNKSGKSIIEYSTINKYFDEINRQELPVIDKAVDPCELSYCVTSKSLRSLWQRSYIFERLLLSAERLIVIANKSGCDVKTGLTESLWADIAGISEHALDSLLTADYKRKLLLAESIHYRLDDLLINTAEKIASNIQKQKQGEARYVIFNIHPWVIEETFVLHLSTPFNIEPFRLFDSEGKEIPYQVVEQYRGDKNYPSICDEVDVAIRLKVKSFGWESINLVFDKTVSAASLNKKDSLIPEIIDNGIIRITQKNGKIIKVEDKEGRVLFGENECFCSLRFYPTTPTNDWYSLLEPIGREDFSPGSIRIIAAGELYNKIEVNGVLGGKSASIAYTVKKGERDIGIDINYEGSDYEGTYALSFSCDEKPDVIAGIPFGVEERDVTNQVYGKKMLRPGDMAYLLAERSLEGLYWARYFTSFAKSGCRFALLQGNGYVFYRHDVPNNIIEVILTHSMDRSKKDVSWVKMMDESCFGQGKQSFSFGIVYAKDMSYSDLHKLAIEREQPFITTPRFHTANGSLPLSKSLLEVEGMPVTAIYQEKDDVIIRGFESNGKKGSVKIKGEGINKPDSCDLCLNVMEESINPENIGLKPWEIKTIRLKGFFDER